MRGDCYPWSFSDLVKNRLWNILSALKWPFIRFLSMPPHFLVSLAPCLPRAHSPSTGALPSLPRFPRVGHWDESCFIFQVRVPSRGPKFWLPGPLYEWRLGLPWNLALPWPGCCSWACWLIVWKLLSLENSQWKTLSTSILQVRLCALYRRNVTLTKMGIGKRRGQASPLSPAFCRGNLGWLNWGCRCSQRCVFYSNLFVGRLFYFKASR